MQTLRDRILAYLSQRPDGADDDELAAALNLRYRQQANSQCRQLAREGTVERRMVTGKIRNFWKGATQAKDVLTLEQQAMPAADEPWHWEGNVRASVVQFLQARGYSIIRLADARRREVGKDIEAQNNAGPLWVTVKGYPKGTPRTRPSTQAGHWFKQALFDIISWRGENQSAALAMALPDFPRYRSLAEKVSWLQPIAGFSFMWVKENGEVSLEGGR